MKNQVLDKLTQYPTLGSLGLQFNWGMKCSAAMSRWPVHGAGAIDPYVWHPSAQDQTVATYAVGVRRETPTNYSKLISAAFVPGSALVSDQVLVVRGNCMKLAFALACLNSFVVDFVVRARSKSRRVSIETLKLLPMPLPRMGVRARSLKYVVERVVLLTCAKPMQSVFGDGTAHDFAALAAETGFSKHAQGEAQPEYRSNLKAWLEGALAHMYGLTEEEFRHVIHSNRMYPEPATCAANNAYRDIARYGKFALEYRRSPR